MGVTGESVSDRSEEKNKAWIKEAGRLRNT